MNLVSLKYIVTVYEKQSFTKAAQCLQVSQPTLSLNIMAVEKKLGTPIFNRSTYPITLTPAGRVYVEWALNTLRSESVMQEQIQNLTPHENNLICIATTPHRALAIMPEIVERFHRKCPSVIFRFIEEDTANIFPLIDSGQAELALTSAADQTTLDYNVINLQKESVLLAAPASMHLQGTVEGPSDYPLIFPSQLRDVPFVLVQKPSFVSNVADEISKNGGFSINAAAICSRVETAYALVRCSVGVSVVPAMYVKNCNQPTDNVDFFRIGGLFPVRDLSIVFSKTLQMTPVISDLIDLITELYQKTVPR